MANGRSSTTGRMACFELMLLLIAYHPVHAQELNNGDATLNGTEREPYVTHMLPTYGPSIGGTLIWIQGGNFTQNNANDTSDSIDIMFGKSNLTCDDIRMNATAIFCKTRMLFCCGETSDLLETRLNITITFANGFVLVDDRLFFTYKPSPAIRAIEPLKTFLRGGIIQTVIGQNLNSIYCPAMTLNVSVDGNYRSPQPRPTVCKVFNNTVMYCPTPYINHTILGVMTGRKRRYIDVEDIRTRRVKRQTLNSEHYKFEVGFILDGVMAYDNVTYTIGHIKVFHDPSFEMWEPETQIFRVFDGDTTISIHGHGLNFGAQMSDYHVNISSSVCKVIELNTGNLVCQPPIERPIHNQQSVDGAYRVSLRVGRISIHVGYLKYYMSRWDDPYFRTPIIATIVTMGAIVLSISIAWVVMKRCYDDPIGHIRQRLHAKPLHQPPPENNYAMQPQRDLIDTLDEDLKAKIMECLIEPATRMTLGIEVGKGNFGKVYSGLLRMPDQDKPIGCAIKTLKGDSDDTKDLSEFLEEATIMKDFKHPNVLSLYGVVISQNRPHVLLPFMAHGDLRGYVSNPRNNFSVRELLDYGWQVAKGMAYLSNNKFVHRDLAARNCMIDDKKVVKIADFGLARDIYERDYYAVEDRRRPMPIKWMAPECLETFKFDSRSDVWSFGVALWEVMVRGRKPYTGIDNLDLKRFLLRGCRLDKPTFCPDAIYALMLDCWQLDPKSRPMFPEIAERLSQTLESVRQLVNSTDSLPGSGAHDYLDMVSASEPLGDNVALETAVPSDEYAADNAQSDTLNRRYTAEPQMMMGANSVAGAGKAAVPRASSGNVKLRDHSAGGSKDTQRVNTYLEPSMLKPGSVSLGNPFESRATANLQRRSNTASNGSKGKKRANTYLQPSTEKPIEEASDDGDYLRANPVVFNVEESAATYANM